MKQEINEIMNQFSMQNISVAYRNDVTTTDSVVDYRLSVEHPYSVLSRHVDSMKFYNRVYSIFEKRMNFVDSCDFPLLENIDSESLAIYVDHIKYKKCMIRLLAKQLIIKSILAVSLFSAVVAFFVF